MPEQLKESEVRKGQDPTVAKQWDGETPSNEKFEDFAAIADKAGVCMLSTTRDGIGSVARSMAIAKRSGPDFLFIANNNSAKFTDIKQNSNVSITIQNTSNTDWISVTGEAETASNNDPRVKELHSKLVGIWFGDLGDGTHDGGPEDPRMALIEVKAKYISYWKHETAGGPGFVLEAVTALATGGVATPGKLRQLTAEEIQEARSRHSSMTS